MDKEEILQLIQKVESQGLDNDSIINDITQKYTEQIDNTIIKIQARITEADGDLPVDDLINFITELCPIVYFLLAGLEKIGTRADVIETMKQEKFNTARLTTTGTAQDKTSFAENKIVNETFVSGVYSRAYKSIKARADAAQATIDALKKSLSAKMSEMQLMRSQNNVMSN